MTTRKKLTEKKVDSNKNAKKKTPPPSTKKTASKKVLDRIAKDKKAFLEILKNNGGIVAGACRSANIARVTYYKWHDEDKEFAEKADDVKEQQKDYCEGMIFQRIRAGSDRMIIFYAQTQMRDRGYGNKQEITGADGADLIKSVEIDLSELSTEELLLYHKLNSKVHGS